MVSAATEQQVVGGLVSFSATLRDLIHAMGEEWPKKQQQLDKPQMDVSVVAKAVTFVQGNQPHVENYVKCKVVHVWYIYI